MKRGLGAIIVAFLCGLPAWPWLIATETDRRWPDMTCPAVVDAWARIVDWLRWFHDFKNLGTELFRCDAQWWFKWTGFTVTLETVTIFLLVGVVAALWVKLKRAEQ